ncbi:hypothetical protein, partial [Klebsiella pneumoniae]|uniref:hypothetical protein n=1 Tax=Klebsiella pneumoniae TaxID=573 RepID=UPI0013D3827D
MWSNRRVPPFLSRWLSRRWSTRRRIVVGILAAIFVALAAPCAFLAWQIHRGGGVALDMLTPW